MATRVHLQLVPAVATMRGQSYPFPGIRPPEGEPIYQNHARFEVEPYVVVDGLPRLADQVGVQLPTTLQTASGKTHRGLGQPAAAEYETGADYRWMGSEAFTYPYWYPKGHTSGYPHIRFRGSPNDTVWNRSVSKIRRVYRGYYDALGRKQYKYVLDQNGGNAGRLWWGPNLPSAHVSTDSVGSFPGITQVVALIPESGAGPYYNILEATMGWDAPRNGRHELRWNKGRIELWINNIQVSGSTPYVDPGSPIVCGITINAETGFSRYHIAAQQFKHRSDYWTKSSTSLASLWTTFGGASDPQAGASKFGYEANASYLEYNVWKRQLSYTELSTVVNHLGTIYGALA